MEKPECVIRKVGECELRCRDSVASVVERVCVERERVLDPL